MEGEASWRVIWKCTRYHVVTSREMYGPLQSLLYACKAHSGLPNAWWHRPTPLTLLKVKPCSPSLPKFN